MWPCGNLEFEVLDAVSPQHATKLNPVTEHLLTYFAIINLVTLILSILDKAFAVRRAWRVPEKLLLTLAWAGGGAGAKFAQIISGHKKLKFDFTVNLNLIIIFQVSLVLAVWSYQITSRMQDQNISALQSWMGKDDKPKRPKRFGPGSTSK